jgi:hypothetical protein
MGQEYWAHFKQPKKVKAYLESRGFPKDRDKTTLFIASEKTKTDCWLSWKKGRLEIASQVFDDQSAWCATITRRLGELFDMDKVGADSTGWWEDQKTPNKPFFLMIKYLRKKYLRKSKRNKKALLGYLNLRKLFIEEAKRLLP